MCQFFELVLSPVLDKLTFGKTKCFDVLSCKVTIVADGSGS